MALLILLPYVETRQDRRHTAQERQFREYLMLVIFYVVPATASYASTYFISHRILFLKMLCVISLGLTMPYLTTIKPEPKTV